MDNKLRANIWKFYLFTIFQSFVLYYGIDKIFMAARGLSVKEIILVEIVYAVVVIFLEVPSGALSDRWSRKYVLVLNVAFFMLNTFLWAIADNLSIFILGTLAASVHMALFSGTNTSFLYDTLKQLKAESSYEKTYGNVVFYENILAIIAGISGAMIADYFGLVVPFWITLVFSFMAILVALSFEEPKIHRTTGELKYWEHIRKVGHYIFKHRFIVHMIVLSIIMGTTIGLLDEYGQLYFVAAGVPVFFLGYISAIGNGVEALGGKFAYVLSKFKRRNVFGVSILLSVIGFIFVGLTETWVGILFVFLTYIAFYSISPLLTNDLHKELPSGQRATGESFVSLSKNFFLIPIALGFSFVADEVSIFSAYLSIGLFVLIYLIFFLLFSYRKFE